MSNSDKEKGAPIPTDVKETPPAPIKSAPTPAAPSAPQKSTPPTEASAPIEEKATVPAPDSASTKEAFAAIGHGLATLGRNFGSALCRFGRFLVMVGLLIFRGM